MQELFLVAELSSASKKDGYLLVTPYSDFRDRYFDLDLVYIEVFGVVKGFYVEDVFSFNNDIALKFKNFDTFEDVQFLIGKKVFITSDELVELPENTFFIHDLIGSIIILGTKELGILKEVIQLPANDIYIGIDKAGKEFKFPAVKDYVEKVNIRKKVVLLKKNCSVLYDEN